MPENKLQALSEHPEVGGLIELILSRVREILGEKLVGFYVYGSLAGGDFDYETSDLDLLAAIRVDLTEDEFGALDRMHHEIVGANPGWDNRLEIGYLTMRALRTFKTETSRAAVMSPGEPFHFTETGRHWLIDWHFVRERGVTIFGAPAADVVEPVSKEELIRAVREQAGQWRRKYVADTRGSRPFQAYAILTMCRALYAAETGEQVSKKRAADWARARLPEWSRLIADALEWRRRFREKVADPEATYPETVSFINAVADLIGG